jgi:sulfur relay (sulfurtransferase) DsrF/TusC family protein
MQSIGIILRKPPYGTVDAPEAIRHALGAVTEELPVHLILVDGGVHAARKGQDPGATGYLSAEEGLRDCLDMGAQVYVDGRSLEAEGIAVSDLVDGARVVNGAEIAAVMKNSGTMMIF